VDRYVLLATSVEVHTIVSNEASHGPPLQTISMEFPAEVMMQPAHHLAPIIHWLNDGRFITCGGGLHFSKCFTYQPRTKEWQEHPAQMNRVKCRNALKCFCIGSSPLPHCGRGAVVNDSLVIFSGADATNAAYGSGMTVAHLL